MRVKILTSLGILSAVSLARAYPLHAASLDIATEYRMRALSYQDLNLDPNTRNNHSFISQNARLGFILKNISLGESGGDNGIMDVGVKLHAVGIAGSTTPFTAPFDRIASNYPSAGFIPFIENAFLALHQLGGGPVDLTLGRQNFRLGSGLLLDDDGAGLTGVTARAPLPWAGLKTEAFIFEASNNQIGPGNLDLFGFSVELPTEGTWQLQQLIEKDRRQQVDPVTACPGGCLIDKATRWFSDIRYQINYGPMVFDGEGALEKGVATPTGASPLGSHITYNGNAEILRAKWKQTFYKNIRGISRLTVMRGSGDNSTTPSTDEAFFPSHGHRFDGMERSGMGEFFGASPYDAFGGHSTSTANGLRPGASGIVGVGLGVTPPAYYGIVMDMDYYLFQAERNITPDRTLGKEFDVRLRYDVTDQLKLSASAAFFTAGPASSSSRAPARRFMFEASGRF